MKLVSALLGTLFISQASFAGGLDCYKLGKDFALEAAADYCGLNPIHFNFFKKIMPTR